MAKEYVVKFPFALKIKECSICHKRFEAGETIYKTLSNSKAYCKNCFEKLLH
jgi:hypothetical protein